MASEWGGFSKASTPISVVFFERGFWMFQVAKCVIPTANFISEKLQTVFYNTVLNIFEWAPSKS